MYLNALLTIEHRNRTMSKRKIAISDCLNQDFVDFLSGYICDGISLLII